MKTAKTVGSAMLFLVPPDSGNGILAQANADPDPGPTALVYGGGLRPLVSQTEDGVQTLNVYGPGNWIIAQVVLDTDGSTQDVRYLVSDHAGSTRVVLDQHVQTVAAFDYSPYGETDTHGDEADALAYRYTGQRTDASARSRWFYLSESTHMRSAADPS